MGKQGAHILIVEDSEDERTMYAHYLDSKGYRVSKAADGKEGLDRAFVLNPDLVVMDLWLPRMNGWDVARHLKTESATARIPVLILTGHPGGAPKERDGLLCKPCTPEHLEAEIARILKSRGGNRVPAQNSSIAPRKSPSPCN